MTLDEFLTANNGGWNGTSAFVVIDEYRWKVAYKENGDVKLTSDGERLCGGVQLTAKAPQPVDMSADVVQSPKKRSKKVEQPVVDELDLDDL